MKKIVGASTAVGCGWSGVALRKRGNWPLVNNLLAVTALEKSMLEQREADGFVADGRRRFLSLETSRQAVAQARSEIYSRFAPLLDSAGPLRRLWLLN